MFFDVTKCADEFKILERIVATIPVNAMEKQEGGPAFEQLAASAIIS
jgi:hypothetical protein